MASPDRFEGLEMGGHTFPPYEFPEGARGLVRVICLCSKAVLNLTYTPGQPVEVRGMTS